MGTFPGAQVDIGNGHFSTVGGNQYNHHHSTVGGNQYNYHYVPHNAIIPTRRGKNFCKDLTESLSNFNKIKVGNIDKKDSVTRSWSLCSNGKEDTEAVVYTARIRMNDGHIAENFTVKAYRGSNAMKEWRRDFLQCFEHWPSRDSPLFGYSLSGPGPSLIFSGELEPIASFETKLGVPGLYCIELVNHTLGCSRNEIWMDPTRKAFIRGPVGPKCLDWRVEERGDNKPEVRLDIDLLKEDEVIDYFRELKDDWLLLGLLSSSRARVEELEEISGVPHTQVISGLTKSIIATYNEPIWCQSYESGVGDDQAMPNGATRFKLNDDRRRIEIHSIAKRAAWLSQALSIFHAHNISLKGDLSKHKLVYWLLELKGTLPSSKTKRQRRELYEPIYLNVIPSLNPVYHWSSDSTGQNDPLSSGMCRFLGLPSKLKTKITYWQESWPTNIYEAIRDHQNARGYDPRTTEFAQFLHFPVFNVVPQPDFISRLYMRRVKEVVYTQKAGKSEDYFGPRDGRRCTSNDCDQYHSASSRPGDLTRTSESSSSSEAQLCPILQGLKLRFHLLFKK